MKKIILLAVALILASATAALAFERFDIITTEEMKKMLDERAAGHGDFILVNALDEIIFRNAAIPGSVNLPWYRVNESGNQLGDDKDRLVVTYWMGYRWVFAYRTAVAVKKSGYRHIKIYNGGIKDWKKSGYQLTVIDPLPDIEGKFIASDEFLALIKRVENGNCLDGENNPFLTILDLRTQHFLEPEKPLSYIKCNCTTLNYLFDDLAKPEVRRQIPRVGSVVTITETGNRDEFAMQYLSKFGYTNISGLQFGMRGWIKLNYPQVIR